MKVEWKPFFLNGPNQDIRVPIGDYLYAKYGRRPSANDPLSQYGRSVGISFNSERLVVNTLKSHRLIEISKKFERLDETVEEIFRSYFEDAKDINDNRVLGEISRKIGLFDRMREAAGVNGEEDVVERFLNSDEEKSNVIDEANRFVSQFRISGVPFFIVQRDGSNKKYARRAPRAAHCTLHTAHCTLHTAHRTHSAKRKHSVKRKHSAKRTHSAKHSRAEHTFV